MPDRYTGTTWALFSVFALGSFAVYALLFPLLSWTTFSEDDAHILRIAADYNWWSPYVEPHVYTQLSAANFTPFVLSLYRLVLNTFSLNSFAFLAVMLTLLSIFTALAGVFCYQLSRDRLASWLAMLLILSSFTLPTLATRFYTAHYLTGGLFSLLALILFYQKNGRKLSDWLSGLFVLLAMLSKEVYLVLPVLLLFLSLIKGNSFQAGPALIALCLYLLLRLFILGPPGAIGGEGNYFAPFWAIDGSVWTDFLFWYVRNRAVLLTAVLLALLISPLGLFKRLPMAFLFVLPTLIVPHAFLMPELHGDRIFFAFDSALAIVTALALHESRHFSRIANPAVLAIAVAVILLFHATNIARFREATTATVDYRITRFLVDPENRLESKTLFVPLAFTQGDLMRVQHLLGKESVRITQNCELALEVSPSSFIGFDNFGNRISREVLEASCERGSPDVHVRMAPRSSAGFLEWDVKYSDGFNGGVLFVDRAFAVQVPRLASLVASPRPGERYQLYAKKDNQWWFSEVKPIGIFD